MLFKTKFLTLIQDGKIETAFRKWTRPTVKEKGTLITAVGQLRINAVDKISYESITDKEIIEAGYSDRDEWMRNSVIKEPARFIRSRLRW